MRSIGRFLFIMAIASSGCAHVTRDGVTRASVHVPSLKNASFTYEKNFHWPYKPHRVRLFRWMYDRPQDRFAAGQSNMVTQVEFTMPFVSPQKSTNAVPMPREASPQAPDPKGLVPPPPEPAEMKMKAIPPSPQPPARSPEIPPLPQLKQNGPVANGKNGLQLSGFISPWSETQEEFTEKLEAIAESPVKEFIRPPRAWLFGR